MVDLCLDRAPWPKCGELPLASHCPPAAWSEDQAPQVTPVLWAPKRKNDPLHTVQDFTVWLFIISSDFNNDLSLRWERIMNHSFTFKTLIKKAQFCFHELC